MTKIGKNKGPQKWSVPLNLSGGQINSSAFCKDHLANSKKKSFESSIFCTPTNREKVMPNG